MRRGRPIRKSRPVPAHLFGQIFKKGKHWYAAPVEKGPGQPLRLIIPPKMLAKPAELSGQLAELEISGFARRNDPQAELKKLIGPASSPAAQAALAIAEFDLPDRFCEAELAEADRKSPPLLGQRTDWRALPLVTIDGEDARDFDDAVMAEPIAGGWRLRVAIADVSHFVPENSALDKQARQRGNSVYLPGRVVPMLPEALSNGLCSLVPGEDRACLAAEMEIDQNGQKTAHRFMRVLIRSAARLTYSKVQAVIDGTLSERDLKLPDGCLHHLIGAYRCLLSAREKRGTLNLDLPERKAVFDDKNQLQSISFYHQKPANQLIEEFMILANVCAAETLEGVRSPAAYRNHPPPDAEKLDDLHELAKALQLPLSKGQRISPAIFNRLLASVSGKPEAAIVHEAVLRCQSRAVYDTVNQGHYGLSLTRYVHFTSPIRRYADLLVHRALIESCQLGPETLSEPLRADMKKICAQISETEQRAAKAERRMLDRLAARFYTERTGEVFEVRVVGLLKAGLFVQLEGGLVEGFISRRTLPDDRWQVEQGGFVLAGLYSGWRFRLGDKLQAKLLSVSEASGGLELSWRSGGQQEEPTRQSRRPHKKAGRKLDKRKQSLTKKR